MQPEFGRYETSMRGHISSLSHLGSSLPDRLGDVVPRVLLDKSYARIKELEDIAFKLQTSIVPLQGWYNAWRGSLAPHQPSRSWGIIWCL